MELDGLGQLNMSNTVKVYWSPYAGTGPESRDSLLWSNLLFFEPELALTRLVKQRQNTTRFFKCPSFVDFYKNTYAIKSPLDLELSVHYEENGEAYYKTNQYGQDFFDNIVVNRNSQNITFKTFSLSLSYLFYSEESVIIEQVPISMDIECQPSNARLIPGQFDISKWWRPIDYACEIVDESKPVEFVRGVPMYYIRFRTKDNKKVELIRRDHDADVNKVIESCMDVKKMTPGNLLEENYKIAKSYMDYMKSKIFPKKKCPFEKFWKK